MKLDRDLLARFPLPHVPEDSDKEDRGRLLVIAGSRELGGAALLAGIAGLRAGAGKLQIATAESIAVQLAVAVPEARVIGCRETEEGCLDPASIPSLVESAGDAQAVVIGCGLQHGPPLEELLDGLLSSGLDRPLVLDAAVLGCLAPRAEQLRAWTGGAALLPHAREMAGLLDCDAEDVTADPLCSARSAAGRYGAVALVKGPCSFIVAPDGRAFRFEGGGVGLATSGSGDVLAGVVGGLCARGADPLTATLWGVWLHGEAGRVLTDTVGRLGFLARELPDLIPRLME
ncbi:MAG TPA: NAD(P)H-hydrate dehydratase [Allosphingosinicella sp.]